MAVKTYEAILTKASIVPRETLIDAMCDLLRCGGDHCEGAPQGILVRTFDNFKDMRTLLAPVFFTVDEAVGAYKQESKRKEASKQEDSDKPSTAMKRMWINQPSDTQLLHHLHGIRVLACPDTDRTARVYFLYPGDVIDMQVPREALSEGWRV